MSRIAASALTSNPERSVTSFGFWIYLMTDCVLFATLFAVYAVLNHNHFGGPGPHELFKMPYVLIETLLLLTSSFTCGLGILAARYQGRRWVLLWFGLTLILGLAFLGMELSEFRQLAHDGNDWQRSAFLSAFFTLVGTHGAHIAVGLVWMLVLLGRVMKRGLDELTLQKLVLLSLFWHFLDLVWIFIFTVVYLFGVGL
jgi:cytochrome o ubiquinol oxidase subunit 3